MRANAEIIKFKKKKENKKRKRGFATLSLAVGQFIPLINPIAPYITVDTARGKIFDSEDGLEREET